MAETVLELQRRYHEERERLSDAVVKEILHKKSTHKENINSEHRTKLLLDRHMEVSSHLVELYQDKDNTREEEIKAISTPNEFTEFYARLKSVKEFHRKHPNEISVPMSIEFQEWDRMRENPSEEANLVDFSGEEGYGRYLDLHESYLKYINLKGVEKVDYLTFLETFDQLFEIPKERKNSDYKAYLDGLIDYLFNYLSKIHPLMDLNQELDEVTKQFEQMWADGSFPGWPKDNHDSSANNTDGEHLDLSPFNSWEELASLGLDRLKSALMAIGLKCGGTLEERAQRLFSTKGKNIIDIDPSLFAKGKQRNKGREDLKLKDVAFAESKVYRLTELVSEQRQATKENVQRKQARAQGEEDDEEDDEDGLGEVDDKDDDDDDVPYNPKNLPLGWDGKPIPYWLYKLHGLNISYVCEICGNFTYKGPKAFQRHFAEWRHAHGMRCLGIPNTAHFANVTGIEDAMKLWDKLKNEKNDERWKPDQEEEYEDSQGNVVNKKTYDDLKRQGLL